MPNPNHPSPWMYMVMTVIGLIASTTYYFEYFSSEQEIRDIIMGFVWAAIAFTWLYAFFERRKYD